MDVKAGIFLSLEKSGLSSCADGKLQWDFLSLCRAYALQKDHLSPFLPQGHQVHPGTRGCSEAGGAGIGAMGVSTFAVVTQSVRQKQEVPGGSCSHLCHCRGWFPSALLPIQMSTANTHSMYRPFQHAEGCQGVLTELWQGCQWGHTTDRISEAGVTTLLHELSLLLHEKSPYHLLWRFIFHSSLCFAAFHAFPTLLPFSFALPSQHGQCWLWGRD